VRPVAVASQVELGVERRVNARRQGGGFRHFRLSLFALLQCLHCITSRTDSRSHLFWPQLGWRGGAHAAFIRTRRPGLCRAHTLCAIGRRQQPPRPSSNQQCVATSEQSGERCRKYAMTGKGVCRIHGGATPPWRWRTVTRWDGEKGRVVEKRACRQVSGAA
jgi:hypothetical protein